MTFPLGSLGADGTTTAPARRTAPSAELRRWRQQALLLGGGLVWLLMLLALVTHQATDPGFSTSGQGGPVGNKAGLVGAWVSDLALFLFGYSAWLLMLVALRDWLATLALWLRGPAQDTAADEPAPMPRWIFWAGLALLMTASCGLEWTRLYRLDGALPGGQAGGVLGAVAGGLSMKWLGFAGSGVLWIAAGVLGLSLAMRFSWARVADGLGQRIEGLWQRQAVAREVKEDLRIAEVLTREREQGVEDERAEVLDHAPIFIEEAMVEVPKSTRVAKERQKPLFQELHDTKLPQVDLLDAAPTQRVDSVTPESVEMTSRLIEKKLRDFGVEVRVVAASPGPVITRYEIEPATGVKGAQVMNLAKDLARSLSLVSIRVVEIIPGKTTMALELPNAKRQMIRLAEILGSQIYHDASSQLTMGLGKDIIGAPMVADLAKMPHCLVAGTTGSGKSVGINAMILSLLYKAEARDVRLLMIDPKMLEMSVYEGIPHLLAPVVTDMRQAAHGLTWCVAEMERRYKLLSKMGVRNLAGYNVKIDDAKTRGEFVYNPFSLTPESPEPLERLPHIVVVIDELADLMMVVGKKIEELIARLAQKARAAGIQLILATQRPSVDVITGLIKANIPTRIAFQVSSKIDSRTILDQMGAEALLGMGDMLYMPSGTGLPIRVHGAFVSDEEVHRVVAYLKSQGEPNYIEGVLEGGTVDGDDDLAGDGSGGSNGGGEKDPMYDQAVEVVLKNRKASISLVQRHLKIGYNRAARLVEDMEKAGLVSAMSGSGQRDILVPARSE